jgi:hypothetical protein
VQLALPARDPHRRTGVAEVSRQLGEHGRRGGGRQLDAAFGIEALDRRQHLLAPA